MAVPESKDELLSAIDNSFTKLMLQLSKIPIDKVSDISMEGHANDLKPLKLSESTYRRGLTELCKAQIIAKSIKLGRYFINPNFVFNGDRIAFTTLIERNK